jgi:hypothetical protein
MRRGVEVSNVDKMWKCLAAAVRARDYVLSQECLDVLHATLKRSCSKVCGRLAMKGSELCGPCYSRSPEGKEKARKAVASVLASVAPVLRADEESRIVATVNAEAPDLGAEKRATLPARVDFENVREVTIPARVDSAREAGPASRAKGTSKKPVAVVSASARPRYGTVWIMCKSRSVLLAATEAATAAHAENTYELNDDGVSAVVTVNGSRNVGGAALRHQIRSHRVPESRDAAKKALREASYCVRANGTERDLG